MFFFFFYEPLVAIIGDIKNSRSLESRKKTQDNLNKILGEINKKYENDIASKFLITLGDEFQGLLYNTTHLVDIIQEIRMGLYPIEVRIGVGIGKITTEINSEMALGADGPGYYNARNAIEYLKENEAKNKTVVSDIRIEADKKAETRLINTIFELLKVIEQEWTEKERTVIGEMLKNKDTQKNVALRMGITQAAVNKLLNKGNYYPYEKSLRDIEEVLEGIETW